MKFSEEGIRKMAHYFGNFSLIKRSLFKGKSSSHYGWFFKPLLRNNWSIALIEFGSVGLAHRQRLQHF